MTGNLATAIATLMQTALPTLFSGEPPPVQLRVVSEGFDISSEVKESLASEPRSDDRSDTLDFDANSPEGPYTLTQPPYPGPRRVWLVTATGDRSALRNDEVMWDPLSRQFSLALSANRDLSSVTNLQVLYGVSAIFIQIKATQTLKLELQSTAETTLDQAEALAIAVIELNRQPLIEAAQALYEAGDYGAAITVKQFNLLGSTPIASDQRQLTLDAEFELKATRALGEDEGVPIERILSAGQPSPGDRPIDVHIGLEV
ncbi:hypothetical protein XM38_032760 [Halomicronema hongdechloris C2206]|uniref:Uncharacterized protein n=1 Tax=Halomicronema hongdechloris C2206 TaxID=1641165 RepID=A0A1Z3HPT4_9CYAN|nr:hypothetical protein [Halomicronema hongdechloris]ASC72319.1 hypothetical protein XM38_032760 [Halomicronema hongdechloris C2206]